jgi:hypothetical protein
MIQRFYDRAKQRDPVLEQDMRALLGADGRDSSLAAIMLDPDNAVENSGERETRPFREYMVKEAIEQYKDYYESDAEEGQFFEYLDNLPNRDKIRFMEIFEDHTVDKLVPKRHIMIEKREFNPELSVFSNMVLDLVDFKDRVVPLTRELALAEQAEKHQKHSAQQKQDDKERFMQRIEAMRSGQEVVDEGYSSLELESPEDKARAFARKVDA